MVNSKQFFIHPKQEKILANSLIQNAKISCNSKARKGRWFIKKTEKLNEENKIIKLNVTKGKIKKREVVLLLIVLMVISLFISGYSMGKSMSTTQINSTTEIAKPILEVENNPEITITSTNKESTYDFKVKNYNANEEITQVDLLYTVEILTKTDESITFKLYKNDEEIPLEENKSEEFLLSKDKKQEDNYKLKILYDKEKAQGRDIFQNVQIKVHTEQRKV